MMSVKNTDESLPTPNGWSELFLLDFSTSGVKAPTPASDHGSPSSSERVRFSTRRSCEPTDETEFGAGSSARVRQLYFFSTTNLLLTLVVSAMCVASLLLPLMAWKDSVDTHNARLDEKFTAAAVAHTATLRKALSSMESRMVQYDAFLQQLRTFDSFRAFGSRDQVFGSKLWLPYVTHAQRPGFEARVSTLYRQYFNDSSFSANITDFVVQDGRVTGFAVAPEAPAYIPLEYITGTVVPAIVARNFYSEPTRARALDKARTSRDTSSSTRIFTQQPNNVSVATVSLVRPVYDFYNDSQLLGFVAVGLQPSTSVAEAVEELGPVSLRLRVFDVTADFPDQVGCLRPILYDGTRDGDTGLWTAQAIDPSYCPADLDQLAHDGRVERSHVTVAQRTWLLLLEPGPDLNSSVQSLSTQLVAVSAIVGACTILAMIGMLSRGWWLMGSLRASRTKEERASQRAKSFLSFVTHELRNPLFALMGTAGELASLAEDPDSECPEEMFALITTVDRSTERMSSIIDDVLNMRKLEEGKMELDLSSISMHDVAHELHAMFLARAAASGVQLRAIVRHMVPHSVVADAGRVVQIASNFLSNAIKFTESGGRIELRIDTTSAPLWYVEQQDDVRPRGSRRRVTPTPHVAFVRISVSDSGVGITRAQMKRLFRPYMQGSADTARKHGGTGLGLSICRQLVECMGGEIQVVSEPGRGSTFAVVLPLQMPVSERLRPRSLSRAQGDNVIVSQSTGPSSNPLARVRRSPTPISSVRQVSRSATAEVRSLDGVAAAFGDVRLGHDSNPLLESTQERILVVDDQRVNRQILAKLLARLVPNVQVDFATNGAQAVEKVIAASNQQYLLVLMDVVMPVLDGRQAVSELRDLGYRLPVIAVTGTAGDEVDAEAGFTETVLKPLRRSTLMGLLSKYLRLKHVNS